MEERTQSGTTAASPHARFLPRNLPRIRGYIDLLGQRFPSARDAASFARIARARGLDPGPLHRAEDSHKAHVRPCGVAQFAPGEPAYIRVSLGPVWDHHDQLREVLAAATDLGGKVHRLDIAADVLGVPAEAAEAAYFPSVSRPKLTTEADALRLRRRRRRLPSGTRAKLKPQRWRHYKNSRYTGTEESAVSAALYSHKASKLDPDGPSVLHFEIRAHDRRVPEVVRCSPLGVLQLTDSETYWRTLAGFVEVGNPLSVIRSERVTSASLRLNLALALIADDAGFCSEPIPRLAELAQVSIRQAQRALSALSESELAPVVDPGDGRSHTTKRRVRHAFRPRGMVYAPRSLNNSARSSRSVRKSSR